MTTNLILAGTAIVVVVFTIILAFCKWDFEQAFVVILEALADLFE